MITNRFDIPKCIRDLLDVAVKHDILDGAECFCLAGQHGGNWKGLTADIVETSWTQRHHNQEGHHAVAAAADRVHVALFAVT